MARSPRAAGTRLAAAALAAVLLVAATAATPPRAVRDTTRRPIPPFLNQELQRADSVVRAEGGPRADKAQLYLSWNAPWGDPRASQTRAPRCGDAGAMDTLYLSFYPGRPGPGFNGFAGEVLFHPAARGDTLGTWSHFERGAENAGHLAVQWGPDESFPGPQPWRVHGQGFVKLDRTPTLASLRLVFAVPHEQSVPSAADTLYTLCRIVIAHATPLAGCDRPVCIEWRWASLAFGLKDEPRVTRGSRFVAWAGPESICDPFRGPHAEAWRPPAAKR
jgi:hypothetical protein